MKAGIKESHSEAKCLLISMPYKVMLQLLTVIKFEIIL